MEHIMTELLSKLFVKNHSSPDSPAVRKSYGTMASIVGITLNILLSALKLFAGIITASVAITADALNNLSDAGASGISLISFKLSAKPADREHPFGHARIEYIASMIVSFLILLVGFEMASDAISGMINPTERSTTDFSTVSIIILSASILGKLWLAIFYHKIAKKIDSSVIKAAGKDSLNDCISTTAVLISSIVIMLTDLVIIDFIVGLGVSALILYAGINILNETKNSLLGEAPVDDVVNSIKELIDEEPLVIGIHDMLVHNYGPKKYISSFHAEVDGKEDIYVIHDAIDNLEKRISEKLGILCTIHMDPIVTDDEVVNELREFATSTVKSLYSDIGVHDFRAVIGATHTNLIFDIEVPFEYKNDTREIVKAISDEITRLRPGCFAVITPDRC